jgi:DAK2 domain
MPSLRILSSTGSVAEAARAARKGADATGGMARARAGRSTYVSGERLKGVNDPGAEAVAILLDGLAKS